jgi:ComF family protein
MMNMRSWFDFLFPPRDDEVIVRDILADDFLSQLSARVAPETTPETVVLLPFCDSKVRAAIHEAKYHGNADAFDLLAYALADYLLDADDIGRRPCMVAVPLGKDRYKERGFNQVEEVIRRATKECEMAIDCTLLTRTRETASQVSLPRRERELNMRGAFLAAHPADPARTYIIVDDVITTGATLQAAIDALKAAGALYIIPLALAH